MKTLKKFVKVIATITASIGLLGIFGVCDNVFAQILCTSGSMLTIYLSIKALEWADLKPSQEE